MSKILCILWLSLNLLQAQNFISANGNELYFEGNPIQLRGLCVGNRVWENIALPIDHISEDDYKRIAKTGSNTIRFYFNYLTLEDDNNPYNYKQSGWNWIDQNIQWAKNHGIFLILNCHVPPGGFQSQCKGSAFWTNKANQHRTTALWRNIADRYKNEPQIAGYDIINEPTPLDSIGQWQILAQRIVDTIRSFDNNHLVIVERVNAVNCNWSNNKDMNYVKVNDKANNIMYTFHFYTPYDYTHQLQTWAGTGEGGFYPDENMLVAPSDIKWNTGIFNNPRPLVGTTDWTYYEGEMFKVTDSTLITGHASLVASKVGLGTVWFDDFIIKEYDNKGVFVRDILTNDIEDIDSWDAWSSNTTGIASRDFGGHKGTYCIKYTGSTADASINNWDNKFEVKYNYSYKISGYIKTKDLPNTAFSMFSISFYNSPSGAKNMSRNKDYLRNEISSYVKFGIENNVPLYVGEFGLVRECYQNNRGGDRYLNDVLNIFDEFKLHYTMHVYRENGFGVFLGVSGRVDTLTATAAYQVLKTNLVNNVNSITDFRSLANTIEVYPNPTQQTFNIQGAPDEVIQVEVLDLFGKVLLKTNDHQVNISELIEGIYIIKVALNNKTTNYFKIFKKE